ncbi:MAG: phosphatidate cytidylyltransferase [Caldilineales bacterium]
MPLLKITPYAWIQDIIALVATFAAAMLWLRLMDTLALRKLISRHLARKLIHLGTGPVFVLCWLLYSNGVQSRWLAALVPAAITLQFALIGLGVMQDEGAVQAMSRSGDRRELLAGPLQYGVVFVVATLLFWLNSPIGIVILMILCGGDGLADIIGRRFGAAKLPWNPRKSWAGSAAMFLGGFGFALAYLVLFSRLGVFDLSIAGSLLPLAVICLAATVVEAVSGQDMDNLTVTFTALGVAWLLTDALGLWQVAFL